MWQQRNRTFLILIAAIGVASLFTFRVPQAEPLLVDVITKILGITDSARISQLRSGFPFGIIQSIVLVVVFYLVVNLNHRASYILRNYHYLSRLEKEIHARLALPPDSVAFTREGKFYWGDPPRLRGWVPRVYIGMLGLLLIAFLAGRVIEDFRSCNWVLGVVDLAIALPTVVFYADYALSSIRNDTAEKITE